MVERETLLDEQSLQLLGYYLAKWHFNLVSVFLLKNNPLALFVQFCSCVSLVAHNLFVKKQSADISLLSFFFFQDMSYSMTPDSFYYSLNS